MADPLSIVIPAFNQLEYCRQCIDSIRAGTAPDEYRLILVDNGSTDGVGEYFDSIEGATVLHAERNLGFAGGVNLGLAEATGHVLLLNSDTLTPAGWLPRLRAALERNERIGIVGPMSNCVSGAQLIPDLEFTSMDAINLFSDELYASRRGAFAITQRLVGFCMLIRAEAFAAIGAFDEQFGIGNYEDDDYGFRAIKAGFELRIALDTFVFHYGSRTFAAMGIHGDAWTELLDGNGHLFREKWKAEPELDRAALRAASLAINAEGREAMSAGDVNAALRIFMEALRVCPEVAENYNDLGAVLWALGESGRAMAMFRRALAMNPELADARANLEAAEASASAESPARRAGT